ncbi:MAG: kynureninase [Acidimicrobiia bacterium]|nr:kynureninase [Acidimicrobiia bacterium]
MAALIDRAKAADAADQLNQYRDRFALDPGLIYLDGNSLGPPPADVIGEVAPAVVSEWARELVMGWDSWIDLGLSIGDELAPILGARPGEVALTDQTSVNLYKLATAALRSTDGRVIVTEAGNFPSDRYVLAAVAAAEGGRLLEIPDASDLDHVSAVVDDTVGLVALSHVDYRTGALHDASTITDLVHRRGAMVLWDLAHSAGAVPVELADGEVDLAVGCTYKYLNGGPGAPGYLYVRSALQTDLRQPIEAWFGHADQFAFADGFDPAPSIRRFQTGTPPVLSLLCARAGIDVTASAGIDRIRAKNVSLTSLFLDAVASANSASELRIVTPREPDRRGAHVAVSHPKAYQISQALRSQRIIVDYRAPDLLRFGFASLYNSHEEAVRAAEALDGVIASRAWERHPPQRSGVT